MKKRSRSNKKTVHTRSKKRTPKHLHIHMMFVYSTMGVFALTIVFAVMHTVLQPFADRNVLYYSSSTHVLGASTTQQSLFSTFLHLLLPNINK